MVNLPTLKEWNDILDAEVRRSEQKLEAKKHVKEKRKQHAKEKIQGAFLFALGAIFTELLHILFQFLQ